MKIDEYGFKIAITYSIQAPNGRGHSVYDYKSKIINKTSYDFTKIDVRFHGDFLFGLSYKTKNYFTITCAGLKDPCWIKFPAGPADYLPWILATTKELMSFISTRNNSKSLATLLAEIEKTTPFPTIVIEVKR